MILIGATRLYLLSNANSGSFAHTAGIRSLTDQSGKTSDMTPQQPEEEVAHIIAEEHKIPGSLQTRVAQSTLALCVNVSLFAPPALAHAIEDPHSDPVAQ